MDNHVVLIAQTHRLNSKYQLIYTTLKFLTKQHKSYKF